MVNRPPPKVGSHSKNEESDAALFAARKGSSTKSSSSLSSASSITKRPAFPRGVPRRGLEWSLRSLHSIDTSAQHFLNNYYDTEDTESEDNFGSSSLRDVPFEHEEDQTAYEIFKTKDERPSGARARDSIWAPMHAPLRTGIVDGKKVVFELRTDVTQRPTTSRQERLNRSHQVINSNRSPWEVRMRLWLMHFSLLTISIVFLLSFIAMNLVFAALFYFLAEERCCDDDSLTFGQVFAFAVQTSTTIGYGSMSPQGTVSNCLVVFLSYLSTLMNTIFAGLLFTKFVTPVINLQFSEVMTICNVNGVPCLSVRLGNADGYLNRLTDINVRLTYSYRIPYVDHDGNERYFQQTEDLKLLSNRQHGLLEVWTLRHVLDETSPLFGLHFEEHPANKIYVFTLTVDAVQDLTKSSVNLQTEYGLEDILIGHSFQSEVSFDKEGRHATSDYSKISETEPFPVWYPARAGSHDTSDRPTVRSFKP